MVEKRSRRDRTTLRIVGSEIVGRRSRGKIMYEKQKGIIASNSQ
jgi:hypothetical protein